MDFMKAKNDEIIKPPIPGDRHVIPITSLFDLKREFRIVCRLDFFDDWNVFSARLSFYYRVIYPERATLKLCRSPGSKLWKIGGVILPDDREPSNILFKSIRLWYSWGLRNLQYSEETEYG